jgi:hypothetical protein
MAGDENWFHNFDPETKGQSIEWHHTSSPKNEEGQNCTPAQQSYGNCFLEF